jgi:NADP-dependent 3-hydroxy acid dehydrogenase YdfG
MRWRRRLLWAGALAGGVYWLVRYFRPEHSTLVLNEKVVIITGASSGIGRALAFAFARRAARIVLVARREDRLEAVRHEIEPYTSDVLVLPADVTDERQLQDVVNRTL